MTLALRVRTMALPQSAEARLYYRAAKQRFDDSQLLLRWNRTTAAVYLAGYTVERFMKALVLANVRLTSVNSCSESSEGTSRTTSSGWVLFTGGMSGRQSRETSPGTCHGSPRGPQTCVMQPVR